MNTWKRTGWSPLQVFLFAACGCLLLAACAPAVQMPLVYPTRVLTPTQTTAPLSPTPVRIWVDPAAPDALRQAAEKAGMPTSADESGASIRLAQAAAPQPGASIWVYAVVAAFPTVPDGISMQELRDAWNGAPGRLLMSSATRAAMRAYFGAGYGSGTLLLPDNQIEQALWKNREAWAIVPFEALTPKMKVFELNGQSPLRKDFDRSQYPLVTYFQVKPAVIVLPPTNRDPAILATVVMTGTTSLVRALAYKMQVNGFEYPARDILPWLQSADILHVSNETAFAPDCPPPDPFSGSLLFCSNPENIKLLDLIGADVIELSGNHVNDWGHKALLGTLELYRQRSMAYFGGGANESDARKPAVLQRGGERFAFIGCNYPGPDSAWATDSSPGAAKCGDYGWITAEIRQLKAAGDIVIATIQHSEYYLAKAQPTQIRDFHLLADAGADVVSGSQAHYAQGKEFYGRAFIDYGPGNLFFDQMGVDLSNGTRTTNTRKEFLDRYVFYNGRMIGVELLTAVLEDYAKPRPMTADERTAFLQEYFKASGW